MGQNLHNLLRYFNVCYFMRFCIFDVSIIKLSLQTNCCYTTFHKIILKDCLISFSTFCCPLKLGSITKDLPAQHFSLIVSLQKYSNTLQNSNQIFKIKKTTLRRRFSIRFFALMYYCREVYKIYFIKTVTTFTRLTVNLQIKQGQKCQIDLSSNSQSNFQVYHTM